jgi:hypothetical protein
VERRHRDRLEPAGRAARPGQAAAAQVTEAVPWLDAKLYGSTQVVDEGRHVEVFHRYLSTKLESLHQIDDKLYVVIDALMSDGR